MQNKKNINLEQKILSQIKSEKVKMKPKWYFWVGSLALLTSVIGLSVLTAFGINLTIFLLKKNGPINLLRIQNLFSVIPIWIPILVILGIFVSTFLLKKYDFSYKKNFALIIFIFILSLFISGIFIENIGLNDYLSKGKMRRVYEQIEGAQNQGFKKGNVKGINVNRRGGEKNKK